MAKPKPPWQHGSVMYQIYPWSFQDSNGDGIGDLKGITQRLDYLRDKKGGGLGIDGIWLSPFYKSPMADFGYDVSDYCDVDPRFGTIDDFDEMIKEAHARDLKLIIDFVPNHTSEEHPWFIESKSSRDNPKRDWYVWKDPQPDGSPPNNWLSLFGGSVWEWDPDTKQYYLHSFLKQQPDLNWENPKVRKAMKNVLRFWLDKGVDGFRIDAIDIIGKDQQFRDEPLNPHYQEDEYPYEKLIHTRSRHTGNFYKHVTEISNLINEYPDRVAVYETWFTERYNPIPYWSFYENLSIPNALPFNFELMFMPWHADTFHEFIDEFQSGLKPTDCPVYVLGNHDNPRLASRIGTENTRAAAMLLTTLPGMVFIYYQDEIGLESVPIPKEKEKDPFGLREPGFGRDLARTPMQWTDEAHAEFSSAEPWLPLSETYRTQNVALQSAQKRSLLNLYKELIKLRKHLSSLRHGTYEPGPFVHRDVMSYIRKAKDEKIHVLINFSQDLVPIANVTEHSDFLFSTDSNRTSLGDKMLKPHEGVLLLLRKYD